MRGKQQPVRQAARHRWIGALTGVAAVLGACGVVGDPGEWRAADLHLSAQLDTVPAQDTLNESGERDILTVKYEYTERRNEVYVTLTLTNQSGRVLSGSTHGQGCYWMFRIFTDPDRTEDPIWSDEWEHPICTFGSELLLDLQPGESITFHQRTLHLNTMIGNGGPGAYYLSARLEGTPPGGKHGWLTEWLPAGQVLVVP